MMMLKSIHHRFLAPSNDTRRSAVLRLAVCALAVMTVGPLLLTGCSGRGTDPKATKTYLYAARSDPYHGSVDVFDYESDSPLRTITDTAFREIPRAFSPPEGNYLLISGYGGPVIWDVRTDQAMSQLSNDVLTIWGLRSAQEHVNRFGLGQDVSLHRANWATDQPV